MKVIVVLATALLIGACTAVSGSSAGAPRTASTSSGGQCLLNGSPCSGTSQCCSEFCANYECVTRDP